jgi:hypothetical protein
MAAQRNHKRQTGLLRPTAVTGITAPATRTSTASITTKTRRSNALKNILQIQF